jgi:hypothetical protein
MRRPVTMLLTACLLGIGVGHAVVAQSPPPYPEDDDWLDEPLTVGHGRLGFGPDGAVWIWGRDGRYVFYP